MSTSTWITVTRDDGETVGYLEPLTPDYGTVQARSVIGHPVGEPGDYMDAEEILCERGISELMETWELRGQDAGVRKNLSILEVSPHGIVVADALLTKALVPTEKFTVRWPDTDGMLIRSANA